MRESDDAGDTMDAWGHPGNQLGQPDFELLCNDGPCLDGKKTKKGKR